MKTRIALMYGGRSVEHEVSVISGIQAYMAIDKEKYDVTPVYLTKDNEMYVGEDIGKIESYRDIPSLLSRSVRVIMINEGDGVHMVSHKAGLFGKKTDIPVDLAFPVVHGTNVEDGALQGYLKTLGLPFVGCDVTASAVGMDKYVTKAILKDNNIPVLDSYLFTMADYQNVTELINTIEFKIGYPVIIKPLNTGSSVGISVAKNRAELTKSIDDAYLYARKIIAEHAITKLREINCAVLGDENEAEASECEEPLHSKDILSYEDKYMSGGSKKTGGSKGMAGVSRKIPAELSNEKREEIRNLAVEAFKKLGCHGVARIDFMIDEENGKLYFNEINTIPGSLAFYLFEAIGVEYRELLDRMVDLALKRIREEKSISYSFSTNILSSAQSFGGKNGKVRQ
ncbi:MAG: D-alanine--D-alanine ligase [Lachnospiraceae bacterium]|nr:D-alanine--D-alanine ligase [Lachnospiraceae bacterium]